MASAFQAIAVDYDGTLAESARPDRDILDAIAEVRARGRVVVLVTGRILSELRADFPDVHERFDAIVAENGGVLADADGVRDLAEPVPAELGQVLAHREIPVRQGRVLLACDAEHAGAVLAEVERLELDCQVVRNRAALMVLPGGVTKGTGLAHALGNLGISRHSTIAIGDAENDHHLLAICELGVAVANAVDALKQRADLVLDARDGTAVAELLRGPLIDGTEAHPPSTWQLTLGDDDRGNPVCIPASQINILLTGGSCSGKSYLAGLLIEQLVQLDYSVLVVDLEGDHRGLAERRGILGVGGSDPLPTPEHLAALLRHRFGSVVLDLSQHGPDTQQAYLRSIAPGVLAQRAVTGLPHWVFFDEAHTLPDGFNLWAEALGTGDTGFCYVTYQPATLPREVRDSADVLVLSAGEGTEAEEARRFVAQAGGVDDDQLARTLGTDQGRAVLVHPADARPPVAVAVHPRRSGHVRHWHKYIRGELPESLRFYFQPSDGDRGRVAPNLREFHRHLAACPTAVVDAHARRHDFSRWIGEVLQDTELADVVAHAERRLRTDDQPAEAVRDVIQLAIEGRYLE